MTHFNIKRHPNLTVQLEIFDKSACKNPLFSLEISAYNFQIVSKNTYSALQSLSNIINKNEQRRPKNLSLWNTPLNFCSRRILSLNLNLLPHTSQPIQFKPLKSQSFPTYTTMFKFSQVFNLKKLGSTWANTCFIKNFEELLDYLKYYTIQIKNVVAYDSIVSKRGFGSAFSWSSDICSLLPLIIWQRAYDALEFTSSSYSTSILLTSCWTSSCSSSHYIKENGFNVHNFLLVVNNI